MSLSHVGAGVLFLVGMAGCAVGRNYQLPDMPVPTAWSEALQPGITTQEPQMIQWWRTLTCSNRSARSWRRRATWCKVKPPSRPMSWLCIKRLVEVGKKGHRGQTPSHLGLCLSYYAVHAILRG